MPQPAARPPPALPPLPRAAERGARSTHLGRAAQRAGNAARGAGHQTPDQGGELDGSGRRRSAVHLHNLQKHAPYVAQFLRSRPCAHGKTSGVTSNKNVLERCSFLEVIGELAEVGCCVFPFLFGAENLSNCVQNWNKLCVFNVFPFIFLRLVSAKNRVVFHRSL